MPAVIMPEETFNVYKDVQAAMVARYGTAGFVQNLSDKIGFNMQWVSKLDGQIAFIKVFVTPIGMMRIEFSKNLIQNGICSEVHPAKIIMEITGICKLILFNNPEDSFGYGNIAVRRQSIYFSSANCKLIVIGLLETLLQG